jgi:peptide/nickel transport system substrate-binding protein
MRRHDHRRATGRGHRSSAVLATGLLVVAAVACGGGGSDDGGGSGGRGEAAAALGDNIVDGPHEAESEPVTGGSITVGLESETNTFLPSEFQGSQAGYNVAYAVFDPLVTRNADGELEPYLAESVESNDDFTRWTVKLRPDVVFHDGTPLNAEALKRNFDDYLTVDGAITQGTLRDVERMEVVDELTVDYVLSRPNAAFSDVLVLPAGWPFSPTAAERLGDAFGEQPVGTGPYRFVRWQRDDTFVVERNPDYWQDGQPYLDEITFQPIPDEESRAAALESGDVDAAQSVRLSSFLARVVGIPGVEVALGLNNGGGNVVFNVEEPPVDDVRIRQSLAYALDQQALVDVVAGEAAPVTELRSQLYASTSPYHSEAVADAWPGHDPERARELLQEYVDDPERSDGKPPGEPVSFTLDVTNVASLIEQGTAFQGLWEDVGYEVTVEPVEQSAHISQAIAGDFQAKAFRLGLDQDPLGVIQNYLGDPETYLLNFPNYHNDTVEETLETLRTTDDVETRAAAVEELGLRMVEDMPVYWTGSDLTFIAYRDGVEGVASWVTPGGGLGDGANPAITFWGQVWREE